MAKEFTFKKFHINAFECGMPVSTDAVLLGAWANIKQSKSILDIGCGTGLLAIMCAQRNLTAKITAVEIEKNAFHAAQLNCFNSPWSDRLNVKHIAIEDFVKSVFSLNQQETPYFDSIICNPPYFNHGEESRNNQRAVARHTSKLTHSDLLNYCNKLLKLQGTASFILPREEGLALLRLLLDFSQSDSNFHLQLSRLTYVKTTSTKAAKRVLIELVKEMTVVQHTEKEMIIHDGDNYSAAFIALTGAFYLKM